MKFDTEQVAYQIVFSAHAAFKDTYGGTENLVLLESHLPRPTGRPSNTVLVFMHPVGGGAYLPIVGALAGDVRRGSASRQAAGRDPGGDALLHRAAAA